MTKNLYIRYISVLLLFIVTALSYHPLFSDVVFETDKANPLSRVCVVLAVVSFFFHFEYNKLFTERFFVQYIVYAIVIAFASLLAYSFDKYHLYLQETERILMAFVFMSIGYNSMVSKKMLNGAILVYAVFVAYVTYQQIMVNLGGFVIMGYYIAYGKNTLGVMCAVSCISLLFVAFDASKRYIKLMAWLLFAFIFYCTITIRARTDMLAAIVVALVCLYRKLMTVRRDLDGTMAAIVLVLIGIVSFFLIFPNLYLSLVEYVSDSFTMNREGDLSTGRFRVIKIGLQVIANHPLFGYLQQTDTYHEMVHNYVLRQLSNYGFIGAIPLVLLYFKLLIFVIRRFRRSAFATENIGYYVFLVLLIVSLAEPTFPYGPGTGVVLPFYLLGYSMNISRVQREAEYSEPEESDEGGVELNESGLTN